MLNRTNLWLPFQLNAIAPAVLAALITGGSALLGQGVSGIGSGMAAGEKAKREKEDEDRRRYEWLKDRQTQQGQFDRTAGMKGIEMLASMRGNAEASRRMQQFRDGLLKSVQGGV